MKKYFLKISGLTTIAIPLVTVIACGGEDTKDTTTAATVLTTVKGKFPVTFTSTKTKKELLMSGTNGIGGIAANDAVTAVQMGYTQPTDTELDGVTVAYIMGTDLLLPDPTDATATSDKTFKVIATFKKGTETATQEITITAMPDVFALAKQKIMDAYSTKTKGDFPSIVKNAEIPVADLGTIGYVAPTGLPANFRITKYQWERGWGTIADGKDQEVLILVTITNGIGATAKTDTKIIKLTAAYDFSAAKEELNKNENVISTKAKFVIGTLTPSTTKHTDLTKIGYIPPKDLPDGVTIDSYTLVTGWKGEPQPDKFDVKFILKKGQNKSQPIPVTIIAKRYNTGDLLDLMENMVSSKTTSEITPGAEDDIIVNAQVTLGLIFPFYLNLQPGLVISFKWKATNWEDKTLKITAIVNIASAPEISREISIKAKS